MPTVVRWREYFSSGPAAHHSANVPLDVRAEWAVEGRNNVPVYRLMLETGLRRNECRSVTWADIDLDAGTITTRPHWEGNKNGKEETLTIAPGLLAALRSWREERRGPDTEYVVKITDHLLRQFNEDLVAAGLAKPRQASPSLAKARLAAAVAQLPAI